MLERAGEQLPSTIAACWRLIDTHSAHLLTFAARALDACQRVVNTLQLCLVAAVLPCPAAYDEALGVAAAIYRYHARTENHGSGLPQLEVGLMLALYLWAASCTPGTSMLLLLHLLCEG